MALLAALAITLLLVPLGAFAVLRARTHVLIQHNLRKDAEAFSTAEAGLAEAVARLRPGSAFTDLLSGPDGIAGTADDGIVPIVGVGGSAVTASAFHADVRVVPDVNGRVRLTSTARGAMGSASIVEVLLARDPLPHTPAAVHLEGDPTAISTGFEGFLLSGLDHALTDVAGAATGPAPPVAGLSTDLPQAEPTVRASLAGAGAQVTGAGGSLSVTATAAMNLQAFLRTAAARPERVTYPPLVAAGVVALGTPGAPQLAVVNGDCDVTGNLSGSGVLVINGALHVGGRLSFTGLVLVAGALLFDPGSNVEVRGALWRGASVDPRIQLHGAGALLYSSTALAAADSMLPGLLPHAARVVGWRQQL